MSVRLFVGNLPYDVTEQELKEFFAGAGPVGQVFIPVDRETGKRRGFAFVEFADRATAELAVRKGNNQMLRGRPVSVNEARPKEAGGGRPSQGGFSGAPRPIAMGPPPPPEARGRAFGPEAKPARNRRPSAKRSVDEERKKGPIRERKNSRLFGFDPEDLNDDDDAVRLTAREDEEEETE